MAILRGVLTIAVSMLAVDGSFKMLASDNACFSATEFLTDYDFHAPADGEVVGVELEHVSGTITCSTSRTPTKWGCDNDWFMLNFLEYGDDGSDSAIFPSSTLDDMTSFSQYSSCSNGHGCSGNFQMSAYTVDSATLVMKDEENPFTVTTADTFSFQVSEGCCGMSTSDNAGVSCAKVYFLYSTDPTHCATAGCDDQLVCNTETGECERNCDVLHIDDFLLDCSAEWDSNTASTTAMDADIATNTANIAAVTASAATNAAGIATNTNSIGSNTAAITSVTNSANSNAAAIATNSADITTVTGSAATNAAGISSNAASISSVTSTANTNAADIATNTNSIATNTASITAIETEANSVESRLSAIEEALGQMAIVSAHSSIGDVDVPTAADLVDAGSWTAMSLSGKDVVIVGMLAVNAVLITSMAVVCCRKQRKLAKYQAVSIASD